MDVAGIRTEEAAKAKNAAECSNSPVSPRFRREGVRGADKKVSDAVSINFGGVEDSASQSAVQGAMEGENKYKSKDVWEDSIAEGGLLGCVSGEDVEELEEEGSSLEQYEEGQLERAIERVKSQRKMREESVERHVEKKKEESEDERRASIKSQLPSNVPDYLVERMLAEDVPVTQENVERAMRACEMAEDVKNLSDASIRFLLQNQMEPTIRNIYHAKFSGVQTGNPRQREMEWANVEGQAQRILSEAGYEWTEENQAGAQWLFVNGLPITGEVMANYGEMLSIREAENYQERNIECVARAMAEGLNPEKASLGTREREMAEQVVQDLGEVDEEALQHVCRNNQEPNLHNLKEAGRQQRVEGRQEGERASDKGEPMSTRVQKDVGEDESFITERRRLEEVRLKMTLQAAGTLIKKGIDINVAPLEQLVEELRELENQYFRERFAEVGVTGEEGEVAILKEATEKVGGLYTAPAYVLGLRFLEDGRPTLRDYADEAATLKGKLEAAGEKYEQLMTTPRKDMGDSIQKAFRNVDDILEDLGYETNEANRRAVRILGYNEIEITDESIERMKDADSRVSYVLKNLHPAVAVRLIKDDVNPLDLPLDELNERIRDVRKELGVTEDERISKYLWQLERNAGITEEERESYIGIYRMLNQIQNMDGAAVGALVEAGGELTLNHLMTAVRTIKSGGVKARVDDKLGATESITRKSKNITDQVNTAFSDKGRLQNLTEDLLDRLNPTNWRAVVEGENGDAGELPIDTLLERLEEVERRPNPIAAGSGESSGENGEENGNGEPSEDADEYYREEAARVRDLFTNSGEEIDFLKTNRIPVTMYNIAATRQMMAEGKNVIKRVLERKEDWEEEELAHVEEASEGWLESMEGVEELRRRDDEVRDAVLDMLSRKKAETNSFEDMRRLCSWEGEIRLQSLLADRESYAIPLVTEYGITNVNLTVKHGTGAGRLQITVDSPILGEITADFKVKGREVKGEMWSDDAGTRALLGQSDIKDRMREEGYEAAFGVGRDWLPFAGNAPRGVTDAPKDDKPSGADAKGLYRLARDVIKGVQAIERRQANNTNIERAVTL